MVGAVGEPRSGVEQWRPRWRKAVEMGLNGPKLGRWKVMGLKQDGGGREGGRAKGESGRAK